MPGVHVDGATAKGTRNQIFQQWAFFSSPSRFSFHEKWCGEYSAMRAQQQQKV